MKLLLPLLLLSFVAYSQDVCSFHIKGVIIMDAGTIGNHKLEPFKGEVLKKGKTLSIESDMEILRFHISKTVDHPEQYTEHMRDGDQVYQTDSLIIDSKQSYSHSDSTMIWKTQDGHYHTGPYKHKAVFHKGTFDGIIIINCNRENVFILDGKTLNGRFYE